MKRIYSLFAIGAAFLLTGCGLTISTGKTSSTETESKIVEQVEAAGSGPIDQVSKEALFYWLRDRMDLALKINKQCKEIRPTATAAWRDSPEGRVCEMAGDLAAFRGQ